VLLNDASHLEAGPDLNPKAALGRSGPTLTRPPIRAAKLHHTMEVCKVPSFFCRIGPLFLGDPACSLIGDGDSDSAFWLGARLHGGRPVRRRKMTDRCLTNITRRPRTPAHQPFGRSNDATLKKRAAPERPVAIRHSEFIATSARTRARALARRQVGPVSFWRPRHRAFARNIRDWRAAHGRPQGRATCRPE
jgi:hypothetical protein